MVDTISALVAGSFAATKEMARLLGEDEFTAMFHQGERDNIQLSLVGDRTLLTILFDGIALDKELKTELPREIKRARELGDQF